MELRKNTIKFLCICLFVCLFIFRLFIHNIDSIIHSFDHWLLIDWLGEFSCVHEYEYMYKIEKQKNLRLITAFKSMEWSNGCYWTDYNYWNYHLFCRSDDSWASYLISSSDHLKWEEKIELLVPGKILIFQPPSLTQSTPLAWLSEYAIK